MGDENVLKFYNGDDCTTLNILKAAELYTLRVNFTVFALYLSKAAILKRALGNKAIVVKIKIQPKFKYKSRKFPKM